MFDSDLPIIKAEQDCLDRAVFSKYLARCILEHINTESLVIGLYGGWGAGKTSIINLTVEELQFASSNMFDDERPVIINFNAWSEASQHQLFSHFFQRIASEFRQLSYIAYSEKIASLFDLYSHIEPRNNLSQIKEKINEILQLQKHKVIIFIDNISRIETNELKQIFQLVKAIADFSNTVYVLAIDEKQIETNVSLDYLKKIVQLPFQVPAISQQNVETILFDRLKPIMRMVLAESWDSHYWADIYYGGLKYFFKSVRDITHYVNTLSFSYMHVKDVVNPVDFFTITAVSVFAPAVFEGIRDNKDLFTDLMSEVYELDQEKMIEDRQRCDEIFQRSEKITPELFKKLFFYLFPKLRKLYQPEKIFYHSKSIARKNKRICSADAFDAYFHLSIPTDEISAAEMNAILDVVRDEQGFDLVLSRLNHDGRAKKFLVLLEGAAIDNIPTQYLSNMINALMDSTDLIPEGESSLISFNTPMRVHRIFNQLLQRIETQEEKFVLFQQAIEKSNKSLYIIVHELMLQEKQHIETEDTFLPMACRDFTEEQLIALRKLAVNKILFWVKIQRLAEHPKFIDILDAWQAWGDAEQCKQFVAKIIQDDVGLLNFLVAALSDPIHQTMMHLEKSSDWQKYLVHIENFIPLQIIEARAKQVFEDLEFEKHREREQLAVLIFLDLVKAETVKIIPKTTV